MKVKETVLDVLGNCKVIENKVYLPEGQLDRKLYVDVDKVLKALGGKWDRKEKAHIFSDSMEERLEVLILTGEYTDAKQQYQFFETPTSLAVQLVGMAEIQDNESVLEPSAGRGRIVGHIERCDCIELNPENREYLTRNGFTVVGDDFMKFNESYDVIVANPPFTKQQDIDHISHMINLARRRVVSIASSSVLFRTNSKTVEFREMIESMGGTITPLPEGTFKSSGTMVNACIVCVDV